MTSYAKKTDTVSLSANTTEEPARRVLTRCTYITRSILQSRCYASKAYIQSRLGVFCCACVFALVCGAGIPLCVSERAFPTSEFRRVIAVEKMMRRPILVCIHHMCA